MSITARVYELSKAFPEEEKFGLTSQLRRAAVSVPSNIAEGSGRNSAKEFKYRLAIAAGSASELFTQVLLAGSFNYINEEEKESINAEISHVLNMIYRLQETLS